MFNWHNPYPTTRTPVFARNVVSTSQPLAAQAGLQRAAQGRQRGRRGDRRRGGDDDRSSRAATASARDDFAIVWDGRQLHGLNASGSSPAAWTLDYFRSKYGADVARSGRRAACDSVTVPGAVGGLAALHDRFGKLPFGDCSRRRSVRRARLRDPRGRAAKWTSAPAPILGEPAGLRRRPSCPGPRAAGRRAFRARRRGADAAR